MYQSGGALTKAPSIIWQGDTTTPWPTRMQGFQWASYGAIYRGQLWVATNVNKIANATARLPLKVYARGGDNARTEAPDTPYAALLRSPNPFVDPYTFWLWVVSTLNIYGESFLGKVRDPAGRPIALVPLHPTSMHAQLDADGRVSWRYSRGGQQVAIDRRDFVQFRFYNPDDTNRGLSPLEPLRSTLENEDGARRASSAIWRNGGRPSVILRHPRTLSEPAARRIASDWAEIHGSVDNWAKAAVLEEGMDATVMPLNVEELQYVESRRLNREEVCAIYDVPPPVVHILDRATFSNITEQMRSMYRDTMAPKLRLIESTLEAELRDGRFGRDGEPDFGSDVYAEFLMDEVLRGDFEPRVTAIAQAIASGQLTPNEGRRIENRPPVDGGDRLYLNSASQPIEPEPDGAEPGVEVLNVTELVTAMQKVYLAVGKVISAEEAREILNRGGAALGPMPDLGPATPAALPPDELRSVMGRLSRVESVDDIDADRLVEGLNGSSGVVLDLLTVAQAEGLSVPQLRERMRALGGSTHE